MNVTTCGHILLLTILWATQTVLTQASDDTLQLVHVLFRHGDRTPQAHGLWPTNPFYNESFYEPYGYGQLTNIGKKREYDLGRTLRKRYDKFLGNLWNIELADAWSTDYNRTKMSMALVLAGLFPPQDSVVWDKEFLWQPIPYNSLPVSQDKELSSWACPTVLPLLYNNTNIIKKLKNYDNMIKYLSANTGKDVDYISALDLYFGMFIQNELGLLWDNWTTNVFPEPLKSYVIDFYYIETSTKELKAVIAGYFLKKIIDDTQRKIDGVNNDRKIYLYSAHETNLGTLLAALEVFNLADPPPYGSSITFEVHRINSVYVMKMLYHIDQNEEPHVLKLHGCEELCPFQDFVRLTSNIIPKSKAECYGLPK